ncbi:MAG: hypothetical protein MUE81_16640 [Thermoflexibacter sp.]|nr:hypothetical protein [Thermoflexibacter sp.]
MKLLLTFICSFLAILPSIAQEKDTTQASKEAIFQSYQQLIGGKWETKGKWNNGQEFHQEISIETELSKRIFTVKTYDYVDAKQFDNAQRNYGIRAWDESTKKMKFWEFDAFGGIITGEIIIKGKDIYHIYEYPSPKGKLLLADVWIYIDKDTYTFKVCEFKDGNLGKEYMKTTYKRKS